MRNIILCFGLLFFECSANPDDVLQKNQNASFYGTDFHGHITSNGEVFDQNDFTAAHRYFPFNTFLLVRNKLNNKTVVVRVNDRGPFKKSRVIDLSLASAKKIGMVAFGVVPVRITKLVFLDRLNYTDANFSDGDVYNVKGNKVSLNKQSVFYWKTKFWKQAFYVLSNLALSDSTSSYFVKVVNENGKREYRIYSST